MITPETDVQELITAKPKLLSYLMLVGLCSLNCGIPEVGTIALIAKEKRFTKKQLNEILQQLNKLDRESQG
jgi:hypothetical protein